MVLKKPTKAEVWTLDAGLPKGYLSNSAIETYLSCPYAYYLQYIEGRSGGRRSPELLEGSVAHKALETNNKEKVKEGDDLPVPRLLEVYDDTFATEKAKGDVEFEDETPDEVQGRGRDLMRLYREKFAASMLPTAVEKEIKAVIGGVPVLGYIDFERKPNAPGDGDADVICDYKVVAKAKSQKDAADGLQGGIYAIAEGKPVFELVCLVKTATPKIERVKARRTPASLAKTERVVKSVAEAIKKGAFPYCSPTEWKCSPKYCGVWAFCPQGGKK